MSDADPLDRDHPLSDDQVDAVWGRFLACVQSRTSAGPRELAELQRAERDQRGAVLWAYLVGERAGGFCFCNVHEAEAFGLGRVYAPRQLPWPTDHPPGSPGKIEALTARVDAGQTLWHPDDRTPSPLDRLLSYAG